MFPIRCPECGLINHRDDVAYPFCGQCHEDLVRCAVCRHHEGSGCRHPRAYHRYTPDGEAARHCPEFRSRYEVRGSRMMARLPAPLWVAALLLIVLVSLATASWFLDPIGRYFGGSPLRVETAVPSQVTPGQSFEVTMRVTNLLNRPSTPFYVEIGKDFLTTVDWGKMPVPEPTRIEHYRTKVVLEYDPLPAGGQQTLSFPFISKRGPVAPFTAKIYAPSNQLRHNIVVPILMAGSNARSG